MKNKEELTVEKLRTFPGHEHHTDEEAQNIVISINKLATILFNVYMKVEREKSTDKKDSNLK